MSPLSRFTISQLAESAGVPTSTVRYYERIGLVEPEDRSAGNYRLYSRASLDKLKFIRSAQAIGFTLDDTRTLLAGDFSSTPRCGTVQELIGARLADVEDRLKDLRHVRKTLKASLNQCRQQKESDCCHMIKVLTETDD